MLENTVRHSKLAEFVSHVRLSGIVKEFLMNSFSPIVDRDPTFSGILPVMAKTPT